VRGTGRRVLITTSWAVTNTSYDTVVAVYEEGIGGTIGDLVDCVDDDNGAADRGSTVRLNPSVRGQDYLVQVGGFNGATGQLQIVASSDAPGNDERAQAERLNVGPQIARENFGATPVDPVVDCLGRKYGKTVWFSFDAPERGRMTFDVLSSFFTVIGLYSGAGAPFTCADDRNTASARIETEDLAAGTYFLQVGAIEDHDDYFASDFDPDEGFFLIEVKFTADPDDDDDGVPDAQDRCPIVPGTGSVRDCPDPDNDGWADGIDDRCSGLGGRNANSHQGCPDNDADGVPEGPGGRDNCPTTNPAQLGRRDAKPNDGCPDTLLLHRNVELSRSVVFAPGGILLRFFSVKGVPNGARVRVVCRRPGGRRCGGAFVRRASAADVRAAARTIKVKTLRNKRLPFGTKITTRVTAPVATGSLIRFKVFRNANGFVEKYFCMNRGSKKPRPIRRGCR
jgi:hypothetical protein